jgi:pimeloyl-ACP methyl ester carboxylesterase
VTGFLALQFPVLTPVYRTFGHAAVFRLLLTTLAYRNTPIDSNYMHWFMAPLKQSTSIGSAVRVCRMLQRGLLELFPLLSHLSHPVLLVWGSHDRLIPLKAGLILNRTLPNSQLEIFRHCAHCAMEEDPERFNALAVNFLKVEPAA